MEDITITTIETYKRLMKLTAIWPKRQSNFFYDLYRYVNLFILATLGALLFADIYFNSGNIEAVGFSLSAGIALTQSFQKINVLFAKKREFREVLRLLRTPPLVIKEKHLKNYLHKKIIMSTKLRNTFLGSCLATLIIVLFTPLFLKNNSRSLPLPFPIDVSKQPIFVYYIGYVVQSVGTLLTVWCSCLIDSLLFTLIWIAVGHCEILNHKIIFACDTITRKINNSTHNTTIYKNYLLKEYLKECAVYHAGIERYVKLIEESSTFNFLAAMECLIPICFMGFSFVLVPITSAQFGRYVLFFCSGLLQFSLFCIPGDELIFQSRKVCDSCYSLEWDDYDSQVRQILFLIMERSKRPFYLTSAKLMTLSVDSLISFMKAAISYFTVLWRLYHDT